MSNTYYTIKKFNEIREDLSDYLFHFTKGKDAFYNLEKIVSDGAIKDINNNGYICFTEAPLNMLKSYFEYIRKTYSVATILAPYGVGLKKEQMFQLGARPVIYGKPEEINELPEALRWRFVGINLPYSDWLWQREWRINQNEVLLSDDMILVTQDQDEQLLFWDIIIDNPYNEEIDESMIDFKMRYKSISIKELDLYHTKQELKDFFNNQEEEIRET